MRAIAAAVFLTLTIAAPALAAPEDLANEIADEVMSPFCDGVTLHDCPSQAALDLRDQIETWAQEGWSKDRIVAELESRYGSGIHATPQESRGVGAWALPVGALLLGIAAAGFLGVKWTRARSHDETPVVDAADRARVERELAALREEMS